MLKFLAMLAIVLMVAAAMEGSWVRVASWVLAFFIVLMLGDLLWNRLSRPGRRSPGA